MTTSQERTHGAHPLERLLAACSNGVEGYRRALASVTAGPLHAVLNQNVVEREEIASVITNLLVEVGVKPEHHGTLAGAVHRGWLSALGVTHSEDAILRECKRGEQATIAEFSDALSHELLPDVRGRIHAQLGRVHAALERLSASEGPQPVSLR